MIRLHAEKKIPLPAVEKISKKEEAKRLAAFLTALAADDVETVKRCLDEGMNYTHPNIIIRNAYSSLSNNCIMEDTITEVINIIKEEDSARPGASRMNIDKKLPDEGVISFCVKNLSTNCLKYFKEKNLYFDAEEFVVNNILRIPKSNSDNKDKVAETLYLLCEAYGLSPNYYIYADKTLLFNAPVDSYHSFFKPQYFPPEEQRPGSEWFKQNYPKRFKIPLFMCLALLGRDDLFSFMVDFGADIRLKVGYGGRQPGETPFKDFSLRELAVLNFSQNVVQAYMDNEGDFSENEASALLYAILNSEKASVISSSHSTNIAKDKGLFTVGVLAQSISSSLNRGQIFNLLYDLFEGDKNNRISSSLTEEQLYNLLVIMYKLDPKNFRKKVTLSFIADRNYTVRLKSGNYRIPLFIISHGNMSDSANGAPRIIEIMMQDGYKYTDRWKELYQSSLDYLTFLSETGVDITGRDKYGHTARDYCFKGKSEKKKGQFMQYGKRVYDVLCLIENRQKLSQKQKDECQTEYVHEW